MSKSVRSRDRASERVSESEIDILTCVDPSIAQHAEDDEVLFPVVALAERADGHGGAGTALAVVILPIAVVTRGHRSAVDAEHAPLALPRA